jgi:aspartate kinase
VAGFQGYDQSGNITTLGRGGSDTTAVALSIALNAKQCHIYTDVDGVYTADPNLVPSTTKLSNIHFSEMLELSGLGAKVMQIQAVELASYYNMPIRVSSSFKDIDNSDYNQGTLINASKDLSCSSTIKIASLTDQVKVSINKIKQQDFICIFKNFAKLQLRVDMIDTKIVDLGNELNVSWVMHKCGLELCKEVLRSIDVDQTAIAYKFVGKISLVGFGLSYAPEIISSIYHDLLKSNIPVCQLVTSEIKVSVLVNEKDLKAAVNMLHTAFYGNKVMASTY